MTNTINAAIEATKHESWWVKLMVLLIALLFVLFLVLTKPAIMLKQFQTRKKEMISKLAEISRLLRPIALRLILLTRESVAEFGLRLKQYYWSVGRVNSSVQKQ